jgi:hypothetical protein
MFSSAMSISSKMTITPGVEEKFKSDEFRGSTSFQILIIIISSVGVTFKVIGLLSLKNKRYKIKAL